MRLTRFLLLVVMSCLGASATRAQDRWVDPVRGDDGNDGSEPAPWKTLTFAAWHSGTTIHLAPGEYSAASGERFPIYYVAFLPESGIHGDPGGRSILRTGGLGGLEVRPFEYGFEGTIEDVVLDGTKDGVPGTGVGIDGGALLVHNRIEGFAVGIHHNAYGLSSPFPGLFFGETVAANTLIGNGTGVALDITGSDMPGNVSGTLRNNVISQNGTGFELSIGCSFGSCASLDMFLELDNNTFSGNAGDAVHQAPLVYNGPLSYSFQIRNNILAFSGAHGLAGDVLGAAGFGTNLFWQNLGGDIEGGSPGPSDLVADPLFRDRAGDDFHLARGSPAIDSGSMIPLFEDRDGVPRPLDGDGDGTPVNDRGAYEFAGGGLRRADLLAADPPDPPLASVFPFAPSNPLTPVVRPDFASGDLDPTPGVLTGVAPLALYQVDGDLPDQLRAVKDAGADSLRFFLRP